MHHYLKCNAHLVFMWKNSFKKPIWEVGWNHTSNKYALFAVEIGFKLPPLIFFYRQCKKLHYVVLLMKI